MDKSILWLGDNPLSQTGLARVTHEVLVGLMAAGMKVACLGRGYNGWPYDGQIYPYPILPTNEDHFGSTALGKAIDLLQPSHLVVFGDLWMFRWLSSVRQVKRVKSIAYLPIDGGPLPLSWRDDLRQFDRLVTASHFAKRHINRILPDTNVAVIYHGVNHEVFCPLPTRAALRARHGLTERFVVGCVARNQMRKQIPALIKAFAALHREYPEAVLYLHTCGERGDWQLEDFIAHYGVQHAVRMTPGLATGRVVTDLELNEIYNLFDVMALPTSGEGFGLPLLEAMACGIPVVATNYSACTELLQDTGVLITPKALFHIGGQIVENALIDSDELHHSLVVLRDNADLRRDLGAKGRRFAEGLGWDVIVRQWVDLLAS